MAKPAPAAKESSPGRKTVQRPTPAGPVRPKPVRRVSGSPPSPESSSAAAPPSPSFADRFGTQITNLADPAGLVDRRDKGFLVVVRGTANLQAVQALCHDSTVTALSVLTARYRVKPGPVFGTSLGGFAADVQRMRSSDWDLSVAAGDILPSPGPAPLDSTWGPMLRIQSWDRLFDMVSISSLEQGTIGPDWMTAFLRSLRPQTAIPSGWRVIVLAEMERTAGGVADWRAAIAELLPILPKRFGLVVSGAPTRLQRPSTIDPDDRHFALVTADELPEGVATGDNTYHYLDSALSGDQPADRDLLDVDRFADGLARLVLHPDTKPLTIGIHGPWGSGKSSFMQLTKQHLVRRASTNMHSGLSARVDDLESELQRSQPEELAGSGAEDRESRLAARRVEIEDERMKLLKQMAKDARADVVTCDFNAWQYDSANQIWAGLAGAITGALEKALPVHRRLLSRLSYSLRNRTTEVVLGFVVPLVIVGIVLAALTRLAESQTVVDAVLGDLAGLGAIVPGGLLVAAVLLWRFAAVFVPVSERVARYARGPDYGDQMGFQHRVIHDLDFVRWQLRPPGLRRPRFVRFSIFGRLAISVPMPGQGPPPPRIVIFIDDLDRCSDDKVVDILQAINLILGKSSFFVFLGMDTEMIYRAIDKRYNVGDQDRGLAFAESYLRKIVQLSFHLPEANPNQRLALIRQMFSPSARRDLTLQNTQIGSRDVTNGHEGAPARVRVQPRTPSAPSLANPFVYDRSILLPPRISVLKEVEDTKEELEAFAEFTPFISPNPREIKRLVNVHRLVRILLVRQETPLTPAAQRKLVGWLIFCSRWGDLVDDIMRLALAAPAKTNALSALAAERPAVAKDLNAFAAQLGGSGTIWAADLLPLQFLSNAAFVSQMVRDERAQPAAVSEPDPRPDPQPDPQPDP